MTQQDDHKHEYHWVRAEDAPQPSSVPPEVKEDEVIYRVTLCDGCGRYNIAEWCPDGRTDPHLVTETHTHRLLVFQP